MNKLEGAKVYLIGAISFASDDGVGWRNDLKKKLIDNKIHLTVFDPCDKPDGLGTLEQEKKLIRQKLDEYNYVEAARLAKCIRKVDLRMVDHSHFVIAMIDTNIHYCGSYNEIFLAESQRKPILTIAVNGKNKLPEWLYAVLKPDEIFEKVDECVEYLKNVNNGKVITDDRWLFI